MDGKSLDLANWFCCFDRNLRLGIARYSLILLLALAAVTASSEAQRIRFGIFMPKMDVYTRTQDVQDRVQEYLFKIKPSEIPLAAYPVISADDLVSYDWETHTMQLREPFRMRIPAPTIGIGVPFVVVADGVPLYVGVFWSGLSSITPGGPMIEIGPDFEESKNPVIRLRAAHRGPDGKDLDPRGDPRLFKVLQELGKLKTK
jgi:hypothetical protein